MWPTSYVPKQVYQEGKKERERQRGVSINRKIGIKVCVDALAPDLSLANLKANMIDPEEITGLDPIGTGSFADVFKVTLSLPLLFPLPPSPTLLSTTLPYPIYNNTNCLVSRPLSGEK